MLAQACEEIILEGDDPLLDPAVAIISYRIGFASPASAVTKQTWIDLIDTCIQENDEVKIELKPEIVQ